MATTIRTPNGTITSCRVAWQHQGRDVYTWRTDGDQPHDFGSVEAAEAFIAAVWHDAKSKEEQADRDAWRVEDDGPRDEWVRHEQNPNDDLDTGYHNDAYEARLEALPFALLREVAKGNLTIDQAEQFAADGYPEGPTS